jgi:hemerythrin-like domain-containing protein
MPNAFEMLRQDHHKVKDLFEQFERTDRTQERQRIAAQTLHELEVHATLEEQIFYPAAREEASEEEQIDEALEEHHVVKLLISELKKMSANDKRFNAKYKVMAESVKHHIEEEESALFPELEGTLDAETLGQQLESRKQKLQEKGVGESRQQRRSRTRGSKQAKRKRTTNKRARRRA